MTVETNCRVKVFWLGKNPRPGEKKSTVIDRRYKLLVMRLGRLERVFERDPIYFVTASTYQRRALLANQSVYVALQQFAEAGPSHGAWLGGYVLMPDHWHGFVAFDDEQASLSTWIKSLKNAVSKTLRGIGQPSPHWQKGFFDHVLRSGESYRQKWDYVRKNPVRAGLVRDFASWPFQGEPFDLEFRHDFL